EGVQVVGGPVGAVAADRAGQARDTRTVDDRAQRGHSDRGVDGLDHRLGVGDVGPDETPADLFGHARAAVLVQVDDDHRSAAAGQGLGGGLSQSGAASGHDGATAVEFHVLSSSSVVGVNVVEGFFTGR